MQESGLWEQVEELHQMSYGWALSCCSHNPTEAEDILQTAYLKILDGRARFDGRATLKTWLFSVIRLTAVGERRCSWLRRLRLEGFGRERAAEVAQAPRGEALEQAERMKLLREALSKLPSRQREVLAPRVLPGPDGRGGSRNHGRVARIGADALRSRQAPPRRMAAKDGAFR